MKDQSSQLHRNNSTEDRWSLTMLRHEMSDLRREHTHLKSKSEERPLTLWEMSRFQSIHDELLNLLSKFANLNNSKDLSEDSSEAA